MVVCACSALAPCPLSLARGTVSRCTCNQVRKVTPGWRCTVSRGSTTYVVYICITRQPGQSSGCCYPIAHSGFCITQALVLAPRAGRVLRPQPLQHCKLTAAGRINAHPLAPRPRAGRVLRTQPLQHCPAANEPRPHSAGAWRPRQGPAAWTGRANSGAPAAANGVARGKNDRGARVRVKRGAAHKQCPALVLGCGKGSLNRSCAAQHS